MAKFAYIARDRAGNKISNSEEASSQDELISRLQAKDLIVINILPESKEGPAVVKPEAIVKKKVRFRRYRVTTGDLTLFCRQLATLLGAGVTILKSLDIISNQVSSRKLYNVIKELQKAMEAGLSF